MLAIYEVMIGVVRELRPVVERIERRDADLARQMRRAMSSVVLNVAEGSGCSGGNRTQRYRTALGSMNETMACVDVAAAMGYVGAIDDAVLDRMRRVASTLVRVVRR